MQKSCDIRHAAVSRLRRRRFVDLLRNCAVTTVRATSAGVSTWQSRPSTIGQVYAAAEICSTMTRAADALRFICAAAQSADTPHRRGPMNAQTLESRGEGFGIRVRTLLWTCATNGLARDHRRDRKHFASGFQCSRCRFSRSTGRHLEAIRSNPQSDRLSRIALRRRNFACTPLANGWRPTSGGSAVRGVGEL